MIFTITALPVSNMDDDQKPWTENYHDENCEQDQKR